MAIAIAIARLPLHAWARRAGSLDALAKVDHVRHDNIGQLAGASNIVCLLAPAVLYSSEVQRPRRARAILDERAHTR